MQKGTQFQGFDPSLRPENVVKYLKMRESLLLFPLFPVNAGYYVISLLNRTQAQFLFRRIHDHLFPCESAGM